MNRKITLLLALLMSISTVTQGVTSPKGMYRDIKKMVEDPLNGTDAITRLKNVQKALELIEHHKLVNQKNIIYYHATAQEGDDILGMLQTVGGTLISFGNYLHYLGNDITKIPLGMVGVCLIVSGLASCSKRHVNCYFCKKKIEEINTVIVKLRKMEADLKIEIELANMAAASEPDDELGSIELMQ